MINTETLKTYVHRISEQDYVKRTMKRLNQEMSPLRDESTKDSVYVRDMWQEYTKKASFEQETRSQQIQRTPEQVHAYLKQLEEGVESQDAQILREHAQKAETRITGEVTQDDTRMQ